MKLKSLNRIRQNKELNWFFTAVIVELCLLALTVVFIKAFYMTNDDRRMMYVLAGYWTGSPHIVYEYINVFLSSIVCAFYKLAPSIPWYTILQFVAVFCGGSFVGRAIYKLCDGSNIPKALQIVFQILFYLCVFAHSCNQLNFHVTASYWSFAAIATVLSIDMKKDSGKKILAEYIISGIFMVLSVCHDRVTGLCTLCYYMVAFAYQLLFILDFNGKIKSITSGKSLKRALTFLVSLLIVFFSVSYIDKAIKNTVSPEYEEYNAYRSNYYDFYDGTYDDDIEAYEELGWSRNHFHLTKNLYFMDESFTTESLKKIVNKYSTLGGIKIKASSQERFLAVLDTFKEYSAYSILAVCVCLASLIVVLSWRNRSWKELIAAFFSVAGFVIFVIFLGNRGRFPLRVFFVVAIPLTVILLLLALRLYVSVNTEKEMQNKAKMVLAVFLLLLSCFACNNLVNIKTESDDEHESNRAAAVFSMEWYATQHPGNIYIYDVSMNSSSALTGLPSNYNVSNTFYWGSSYMYSPAYYKQLELNGLDKLNSESFMKDNVYLISATKSTSNDFSLRSKLLFTYLNEKYGAVGMDEVDVIYSGLTKISVFHFVYNHEKPSKDGFVVQNGIKYYYKNGKKATGLCKIKGDTYYFLQDNCPDPFEKMSQFTLSVQNEDEKNESDQDSETDKPTLFSLRYDEGKMMTGQNQINQKYYYFASDGKMLKNSWLYLYPNYYYFGPDGAAFTGAQKIYGKEAVFGSTGALQKYEGLITELDNNIKKK